MYLTFCKYVVSFGTLLSYPSLALEVDLMCLSGAPHHTKCLSLVVCDTLVCSYLTICNKFYLVWAQANLAYFLEPSYLVCLTTPTDQNVCHMRIMHFWTVVMKSRVISSGMLLA